MYKTLVTKTGPEINGNKTYFSSLSCAYQRKPNKNTHNERQQNGNALE